ncbi:hypothetical protein [Cryobacterium cryoconiti]|uniref:DUF559 domain-containing protein n=1 Tax=Cryobacterium cryoconiti TaxID=1259239 RepID=A0A4Y8JTR3_9MICO|nr:hypothetical protein [Cryobacterium cryoconiti]TFD29664.1 hypothetical protein E3T49_09620 [Cryobacterium cryoconiti]
MTARSPLPPPLDAGAFRVGDGLRGGLSRDRMRATDLARPFWGIRVVASGALTTLERCNAILRRMPPGAFFSHHTAALIIGIPVPLPLSERDEVHIGVAAPDRSLRSNGIVGHSLRLDRTDLRLWHGLPVTSPARTWCDLATVLTLRQLVAAGDYLIHRRMPLVTLQELAGAVEWHAGRRGHALLRQALPLLSDRAESPPESEVRVITVTHGLPKPLVNHPIHDRHGRLIARADLYFRDYGELVEYEGDHHRTDLAHWRRDLTRTADVEAEGLHVTRVNADDLHHEAALAGRIAANLRRRGWTGQLRPPKRRL